MKIDKEKQLLILEEINTFLQKTRISGRVYLFGGNGLIIQDVILRTTKDIDCFLFIKKQPEIVKQQLQEHITKTHHIKIDIGITGEFPIAGKGFTWVLPESA